jgi:hypothetical protein
LAARSDASLTGFTAYSSQFEALTICIAFCRRTDLTCHKKLFNAGYARLNSLVRRIEIINGIDRLLSAIDQSGVGDRIESGVRREQGADTGAAEILDSFHKFALLAQHFGFAESQMVQILGLSPLLDVNIWALFVAEGRTPMGLELYHAIREAREFLPRFKTLIEQDYVEKVMQRDAQLPKVLQGKTTLSVIAIEERDQFSTPRRVIEVIESVTLIYEATAILNQQSSDDLIVLTCDSGSDKSFDFLGAAKIIEQVKELILGLWDKVVFFRERKAAERIELVAKSLPVIERISQMREAGALSPEQAEIVSRKIVEGAEKFLKSGATIPEIANRTIFNDRALLAPQTMLLTGAVIEASDPAEEKPKPEGSARATLSLSPSEQAELQRLLDKMRGGQTQQEDGPADQPLTE